ncbi:MAG: hypothetical protein ABI721_04630 [Candidatus Dojkabacteria bacterium]
MSKSVVTLLDKALLPAAVMIFGKFIGVAITIRLFNLPWTVGQVANSVFSNGNIIRPEDLQTVISYSDLIMYMLVAIGMAVALGRAIYLHNSHVKPSLVARLANYNLLSLITDSYDIYHSATVWLLFTWIANLIVIINVISKQSFPGIAILVTIISIASTLILFQDIYKEIENIKTKPGKYQWV